MLDPTRLRTHGAGLLPDWQAGCTSALGPAALAPGRRRQQETLLARVLASPRKRATALVLALAGSLVVCAQAAAQTSAAEPRLRSGRNVNMAGGTQVLKLDPYEVRGDVLGRAQNESSCAISTRNPQHILCGANDYRMVDVPGVTTTQIIRDAWLGALQSADGGDTWESALLGGFYLDPTPNPLKQLNLRAGADAIVRSGPAGMAWYGGIALTIGDIRRSPEVN